MMKRVLSLMMVLVLSFAAAAEGFGVSFEEYALYLADFEEWKADGSEDIQVLMLDEDVSLNVCLDGDEVIAMTIEAPLDCDVESYALMALSPLNVADEETLALLETLQSGEMLDCGGWWLGHLVGETREGICWCVETDEALAWQPMHGGEKRHSDPNCSGMDVPRLVTENAAEACGYERCKRCDWTME